MRAVLFIALRHLRARKLLNGIAIIGVALGVLMLVSITGIMRGFQGKFLDTILEISPHTVMVDTELRSTRPVVERLLPGPVAAEVRHQARADRQRRIVKPAETLAAIRRLDGVTAAAPVVVGSAVAAAGAREVPVELRGIDAAVQEQVTPLRAKVVAGDLAALEGSVDGALIGVTLAELLGVTVGDRVTCAAARGDRVVLRVVGLFETGVAALDKGRIYVSRRVAQVALGRGDVIDRIELRLQDPGQAPAVTALLERMFGYDAESWQETNAGMLSVFDQQNLITGFMIGAVLIVGGFGILAIQIMIVLEKRRDIALLKSVGYPSRSVLAIFLSEGAVVAVIGALLGSGAGHLLLGWLRGLRSASGMGYSRAGNFAIYERPSVYVLAFTFAVLVGLVASAIPAWRASRVEPVDVLRGGA